MNTYIPTNRKYEKTKLYFYFIREYKKPLFRNFLSKLIKLFSIKDSEKTYSHVGIIIDEYVVTHYNPSIKLDNKLFNQIFVLEAIAKSDGVIFTTLNQNNMFAYIDVYSIDISYHDKIRLFDALFNEIGKKYDYRGFFSFVFRFLTDVKSRWYCSELFSRMISKYIHYNKSLSKEKISPSALYSILSEKYGMVTVKENIFINRKNFEEK